VFAAALAVDAGDLAVAAAEKPSVDPGADDSPASAALEGIAFDADAATTQSGAS
jgi:hypothetical protein